jgi:hypothetical protein
LRFKIYWIAERLSSVSAGDHGMPACHCESQLGDGARTSPTYLGKEQLMTGPRLALLQPVPLSRSEFSFPLFSTPLVRCPLPFLSDRMDQRVSISDMQSGSSLQRCERRRESAFGLLLDFWDITPCSTFEPTFRRNMSHPSSELKKIELFIANSVRTANLYQLLVSGNWDSPFGIPVRLRSGRPVNWGLIPGRGKRFFLFQWPDRLWAHPTYYPMCTVGSFPGGKAVRTWSWQPTPHRMSRRSMIKLYIHSPISLYGVVLN